ncbi:hypothetical protein [Seonamhaeicola sp.]|uniref:hypothetical protein n=1 Tax=Seonamhaeicola sp. TaxID=1912245 RepID=UPI00262C3B7F|nr:hypothetical protein [Seonamhaeicola sp.]
MSGRSQKYRLLICIFSSVLVTFNCSKDDNPKTPTPIQKEVDFVKTLGGTKNESARSIIQTSDGGYAVLGYTQSNDGDITNKTDTSFDCWLLKYNQNSTLEWQKTYGGSGDDRGHDIIQTTDGGYAVLGYSKSNDGDVTTNNGLNDFWVVRLDSSGDISWEKSFGFSGTDTGHTIIQTNDGGFLITGVLDVSASGGQGNSKASTKKHAGGDYWAVKLNVSGALEWSRYYGGTFTDTPYDVIQTADNGYILVGSSDSDDTDIKANKGSYDFWVVKISDTGTLLWEKSFGGTEIDEARGITKTNDGNYLIIGDTRSSDLDVSFNNGAADFWVFKMSPSGDLIWEKAFGGSSFDAARSITKTQDGGFIICGSSRSANADINNNGQNDAWVIKIDSNGNMAWQKSIGGSGVDLAYDALALSDNSVIIVGESGSSDIDVPENKGFSDLLIFKIK